MSYAAGDELPASQVSIPFERIAQVTATTGDWYPGHYNPEYAAEQSQPTIFASTLYLHGIVDKFVTDTFGSGAFIFRRRMRMLTSVYAGFDGTISGTVIAHDQASGHCTVTVELAEEGSTLVWAEVVVGADDE
jgi:acyl dehydratase